LSTTAPHTATCPAAFQDTQSHSITALYNEQGSTGSSSSDAVVITPAGAPVTSVTIASSGGPWLATGQPVTYTAVIRVLHIFVRAVRKCVCDCKLQR
jgi:hypothetical protein